MTAQLDDDIDRPGDLGQLQAQRDGIDPADLAVCLRVLTELDDLPLDHPDAISVRLATAQIYKNVKQRRRRERRDAVLAADEAVTAATATGAPDRIDDET
jgi:hypothetical protein